jgi:hypothetical protein
VTVIGARLGLALKTVANHASAEFAKLHVVGPAEAVDRARRARSHLSPEVVVNCWCPRGDTLHTHATFTGRLERPVPRVSRRRPISGRGVLPRVGRCREDCVAAPVLTGARRPVGLEGSRSGWRTR